MANSLLVGISGLRSHQEMLQVIGNNLANVDTTAFKSSRVLFSDLVYQNIKEAQSGATGIIGSVNPIQAGSGTNLAQVDRNDAQGNLEQTGRQLDLAIEGAGYFVLQTADGPVYTRAGAFGISNDGTLVDPSTGTPLQRIGDIGEPDGVNPAFQVNGDDSIKIPLGARIPGLQTSQLDITGTIPRNATAQLANVVHSESRFLTGGNIATTSTLINDLDINVVDHIPGDLIRIAGNDVDFTPVSVEFSVDGTTTMADLVSAIDTAYPGADVTFSNGRIVATSRTKGISHLNIRLDYIQPSANPDGSIPPHGETEFSSIPMVDQVEGTEATSVSFASTQMFDTRGSSFTMDLNLTKQEDGSWSLTGDIDPTIGEIVDGSVTGIRFADDGTLVQFGGTGNGDSRFVLRLNDQSEDQIIDVNFGELGSLDGLAMIKLIGSVRKDVKIIANDFLSSLSPLQPLLLPVDNMGGKTRRENLDAIDQFLQNEGALIIFPAGEVSRVRPNGIKDTKWHSGFLRIASKSQAPILPVFIDGRNSVFFYSLSMLSKPLSTIWLVHEMFKQASNTVSMRIGGMIDYHQYQTLNLPISTKVKLFRRHLYRLGKNKSNVFNQQKGIAHPENRQALREEIQQCELLGETKDGKRIHLYRYQPDSCVMREIGRLREVAFRAVGEGTGKRRDIDAYDQSYLHLVLWDDNDLEIAGAYRIADCPTLMAESGHKGIYSNTLFEFEAPMQPYLEKGLELGRSFVQPKYWGRRSLDYLWYGLGAFLRKNPEYRYLFGPVSISGTYPQPAKDLLVYFYQRYFGSKHSVATSRTPYLLDSETRQQMSQVFSGNDYQQDFAELKTRLAHMGLSVPTLYKQYTEVCEAEGVRFLDFNIDPDFSNCIDGLVIVDTQYLKASRRKRYIGE